MCESDTEMEVQRCEVTSPVTQLGTGGAGTQTSCSLTPGPTAWGPQPEALGFSVALRDFRTQARGPEFCPNLRGHWPRDLEQIATPLLASSLVADV